MPVKLNSSGGGSVTLTTPSTAVDYTATFPANTGNVVTDGATQTLTNKTLGGPLVMGASVITSGTAQASTSGTSIDFTGIPSWVKRVTVMFNNVSTNGTSEKLIQLIHSSGTVVTSGYRSAAARLNDVGLVEVTSTAGFLLAVTNATDDLYGSYVFTNLSGNIWTGVGSTTYTFGLVTSCGGVTIASTLTGIRITTVGGTDTFDGGSINILYE
jgi:hypothetical protein